MAKSYSAFVKRLTNFLSVLLTIAPQERLKTHNVSTRSGDSQLLPNTISY
jgi:hypothetical protein